MRSGIEIYGRARGALTRPSESAPIAPTSDWGRTVAAIEHTAAKVGERVRVTVGAVRLAPVLCRHVPSPLGRLLRQPGVPFSVLADPPFAVIEDRDAARPSSPPPDSGWPSRSTWSPPAPSPRCRPPGAAGASRSRSWGPTGGWHARISYLLGAPIPDHVSEALHRGRLADNGRMRDLLGIVPEHGTVDVIDRLYHWPSIIHQPARVQVA